METVDEIDSRFVKMVHRTQAELSLVVKDVVFEDGKSVSIVSNGSSSIQYVCSDKSCHWKVYFGRDNVTRTRTKEECMFHVSKNKTKTILTHSAICVSVKKPSLLQLEKMSSMNVAVDGDSQCKGKALLVAARSEGVRLEKRKSTMYAAKNSILKKNDIGEAMQGSSKKKSKNASSIFTHDITSSGPSSPSPQHAKEQEADVIKLPQLLCSHYFEMRNVDHFRHWDLLHEAEPVWTALDRLSSYLTTWLQEKQDTLDKITVTPPSSHSTSTMNIYTRIYAENEPRLFALDKLFSTSTSQHSLLLGSNVCIQGGAFDLSGGSIYLGNNVVVEPGVCLQGPLLIDDGSTIRFGAYLRGPVLVGRNVVVRCEMKNTIIMDFSEFAHPGYIGDSITGFRSHAGNMVSTANLSLMTKDTLKITCIDGEHVDTKRRKLGIILGDGSQLGCGVVTDPCTLIGPRTVIYPLTRLNKGLYGPDVIIKNKPMEHGIVEIVERFDKT